MRALSASKSLLSWHTRPRSPCTRSDGNLEENGQDGTLWTFTLPRTRPTRPVCRRVAESAWRGEPVIAVHLAQPRVCGKALVERLRLGPLLAAQLLIRGGMGRVG
jgi:hypothetical protein